MDEWDFSDYAAPRRENEHLAREHARGYDMDEDGIDYVWLMLLALGVLAIVSIFKWGK